MAEVKKQLSVLRALTNALNRIMEMERNQRRLKLEIHEHVMWPRRRYPILGITEVRHWLGIIPWGRAILEIEIRGEGEAKNIICTIFDQSLDVEDEMRRLADDILAATVTITQDLA